MIGLATVIAIIFAFLKFFGGHAGATTPTDPTVIDRPGHSTTPTRSRSTPSTPSGCWSRPSWCSSCRPASWSSRPGSPGPVRPSNVLLECIVDTCLCGLLFWAFGFAFMFGAGNGCIGHTVLLPARRAGHLRARRASRSWRSSCSSSPSPTPARRSPRAPWSVAPASWATSSTASACRASSTRSSATGSGVRAAGWPPWTHPLPFHDFAGSTVVHTDRWLRRPRRRHRPRAAPRPQVQA